MKIPDEIRIPTTIFMMQGAMLAGLSLILYVLLPN